jgi:iron complex transport system permease protein
VTNPPAVIETPSRIRRGTPVGHLPGSSTVWTFAVLTAALTVVVLCNLGFGTVLLSPAQVLGALVRDATVDPVTASIVWDLRLPRVLVAGLVGAGLGMAGVAYQGLFRNPLAEPYVIGASNGAALGAVLVIVMRWSVPGPGVGPASVGAFVGALGTVGLVYFVAAAGRMSPPVLLLAGVVISAMLGSFVWLLLAFGDHDLIRIIAWLMGGFSGRGWASLQSVGGLMALGMAILWASSRMLDALCSGEESARVLGLRVGLAQTVILTGASLATAAAVAVGGVIGFVGLVAPHLARKYLGGAHARLIPGGGLFGAMLLMAADGVARSLVPPLELPVGVVTAVLGGPFFLVVLRRQVTRAFE